jgi:membrane dipeptidase
MSFFGGRMLPLLGFALPAVMGWQLPAATTTELDQQAQAMHARLFTLDTHIDTPTGSLWRPGWDIAVRHDVDVDFSQCDFPRMKSGGLDAGFFVVYLRQGPRTPEGYAAARDRALRLFLLVHRAVARNAATCELALTADDGPRIAAASRLAIYISVENGYAIGKDLSLLRTYHDLGARLISIAHSANTDLGDSATDLAGQEWNGLSPLGREMVAECNRLGLVLDGSHASPATVRDLLSASQTPILLSHSGCRAVFDHPRNADDDLIRAVASQGGVIQITAAPNHLKAMRLSPERNAEVARVVARLATPEATDEQEAAAMVELRKVDVRYFTDEGTLDDFMKHVVHAIEVAGIDHVGIGADLDGGGGGLKGLKDVADYPNITRALIGRGYDEPAIAKIWGGNTLRVLRSAEKFAAAARRMPAQR